MSQKFVSNAPFDNSRFSASIWAMINKITRHTYRRPKREYAYVKWRFRISAIRFRTRYPECHSSIHFASRRINRFHESLPFCSNCIRITRWSLISDCFFDSSTFTQDYSTYWVGVESAKVAVSKRSIDVLATTTPVITFRTTTPPFYRPTVDYTVSTRSPMAVVIMW